MKMIGHHHKFAQFQIHILPDFDGFHPFGHYDVAGFIQNHGFILNFTKIMQTVFGANANKIGSLPIGNPISVIALREFGICFEIFLSLRKIFKRPLA